MIDGMFVSYTIYSKLSDIRSHSAAPMADMLLQAQVRYTRADGAQCLRVFTEARKVSDSRAKVRATCSMQNGDPSLS